MQTSDRLGKPFGAAFVLGFALSGFFDGVLLHQILQWHHLLSLVEDERVQSLRVQILADGLFHALMYAVAVVGLILLWRSRQGLAAPGGSRRLWGGVLIGFGAWNIVDIGLFHWILEIHHIRVESSNPIAWDVGWLLIFGAIPLLLGRLLHGGGEAKASGGRHGHSAALPVALLVTGAGIWAAKPPPDSREALVLFMPGMSDGEAINAVLASRGLPLAHRRGIWAVRWSDEARPLRLYRHGAVLVGSGWVGGGCLGWSKA